MIQRKARTCIYCGKPTGKVRRGEHLIPEAIGGTKTTKNVCPKCNNGPLSDIDKELCSRSPLSIAAAIEIDGFAAHSWDVDESDRNLLLEAKFDRDKQCMKAYPQLIIDRSGVQLRADFKDLIEFGGPDKFHCLLMRRLRKAYWEHEHNHGKSKSRPIWFSPIQPNLQLLSNYRYPPRFFVRGTVPEACGNKSIELGYIGAADRRFALAQLENGSCFERLSSTRIAQGSYLPTIRCFFDAGKVWRALAKITINLLHHYCVRTNVTYKEFQQPIEEILGVRPFSPARIDGSGFVWASDIAILNAQPRTHVCRLHWSADGGMRPTPSLAELSVQRLYYLAQVERGGRRWT